MTRLVYAMLLLMLVSCGNKSKPTGLLKPEKMKTVLWQILRAEAYTFNYVKKDSTKNELEESAKLQKKIFAENGVTREDFYNSYEYYKKNPSLFKTMMDSIISAGNRTRNLTQPQSHNEMLK